MKAPGFVCIAVLMSAGGLRAATYTVTEINLGGVSTAALAINSSGVAVGNGKPLGNANEHGYRFENGAITDLGTLGGNYSIARDINASGIIVGQLNIAGNVTNRGFVAFGGVLAAIGTLGGTQSFARGVNASGAITGYSDTTGDVAEHAFRLVGGTFTDLGSLAGATEASHGLDINDLGEIVGYTKVAGGQQHGFVFLSGAMADLDTLGGSIAEADAINNSTHIVGYSNTSGNAAAHAFLNVDGITQDLGTLGGTNSQALAINSIDQIVGYSQNAGAASRAFIYEGAVMKDLNALVPDIGGWVLQVAYGINDSGQIVGSGTLNGAARGFLLTPVVVNPAIAAPSIHVAGKKRIATTKPKLKIKGTATGSVTRILYRTRAGGSYKTAIGTNVWRFVAKLKPGKNRFTIQAQGPGGFSNSIKVTVVRQ